MEHLWRNNSEGENGITCRKTCPSATLPITNLRGLNWHRTRISKVRRQRLSWVMTQL